ncbi:MAG: response regulator transcription factor [Verrucomicrobia bacterium]|nr:response regulator transcription factor [Verrucomicrobiota bacterium]
MRFMLKALIVEDQTAVRQMIAQVVQATGMFSEILECGDGQEALRTCVDDDPDFIVLDLMLPGLNGIEVLRRVRRVLPKVKVLVFSGYQDIITLRDLVQAGANGFIAKSAPLAELQRGIVEVAKGESYFSPEVARTLRDAMASSTGVVEPAMQRLTTREREILQLIAESNSTKDIAARLGISVKTAENHRTNLMKKLDLHDIASLTRFAIEHGLIEAPSRL